MQSNHSMQFLLPIAALFAVFLCLPTGAQEASTTSPDDAPMILRITTREVVIDLVARNRHNKPVTDLTAADVQVFELGNHKEKHPHPVLALHMIDPHHDASRAGATDSGFRISTGATCALNATTHYELAISASPEPGFHEVLVQTTRAHITLVFRHHYYVGPTVNNTQPKERKAGDESMALAEAACYRSLTPPTLAITAHPLSSPGAKTARYAVIVRPESLSGIGLDGSNRRIQLDFGMCTFDSSGAIAQYLHSSTDRELSAAELDRAHNRGLANLLEIPSDPPHLARFVVRDRQTGNLGMVDVARPVSLTGQAEGGAALPRPMGSVRSFGVVTPRDSTFCGDVYELPSGTAALPDFWTLDPVGSIFTDTLKVYNQDINLAEGIPGVTRNNTWFGIDYYGEFFITKPGNYGFELQSDDGSRLEIDERRVLDLDGVHPVQVQSAYVKLSAGLHTIHIPYFQGPPNSLALVLSIKPPGESMHPFNITDYAVPQAKP